MNRSRPFPPVGSRCRRPPRLCILLGALIIACQIVPAYAIEAPEAGVRPDGAVDFLNVDGTLLTSITVEIAETRNAHVRGLQGRRFLAPGFGMLFLYETPRPLGFWMRHTLISIDIIYVGEDQRVLNVHHRVLPQSDQRHWSAGPAKYVVEVPAGFAEKHGIEKDSVIRWQRSASENTPHP